MLITWNNETKSTPQWAKQLKCSTCNLRYRIHKYGVEEAFLHFIDANGINGMLPTSSDPTAPFTSDDSIKGSFSGNKEIIWNNQIKTLREWATQFGCQPSNLATRINKHGVSASMQYYSLPKHLRKQGRHVRKSIEVKYDFNDPVIQRDFHLSVLYLKLLYQANIDNKFLEIINNTDPRIVRLAKLDRPGAIGPKKLQLIRTAFRYRKAVRKSNGVWMKSDYMPADDTAVNEARKQLGLSSINNTDVIPVPTAMPRTTNNQPERKLYETRESRSSG